MSVQKEDTNENAHTEGYVCDDPVILDAFADMKAAILSKRNDIVRQILSAAQSLRDDDEYDSEGEERDKKVLRDKYDSEEYLDLLSLLLIHKDTDSGTLLHYATRIDSADIARTLLASGANCTILNHENRNPYMYCSSQSMQNAYIGELVQSVSQSRLFRVEQLLLAGIDVNSCDGGTSGNTVLHWAVSFADLSTVKLIIEKGADVNSLNSDGVVPLHDSIQRGDEMIIEELLKNGASVNVKPFKGPLEGKTPLDLVEKEPNMKNLIERYIEQETINSIAKEEDTDHSNDNDEDTVTTGKHMPIKKRLSSTSSTLSIVPTPSLLPVPVQVDPLVSILCPPPQRIRQFKGLYFVPPNEMALLFFGKKEDILKMRDMMRTFEKKFLSIGINLVYQYNGDGSIPTKTGTHLQCIINSTAFSHKEEYRIQINTHKSVIVSSCIISMFHGISTFLQCLKLFRGKSVPLLQISDWPSCVNRSVILDFFENDLPKLDILYEAIDLLALFKINQIQLNIDHIGTSTTYATYTKREFFNLQVYCETRFINVVPYIVIDETSSFVRHDNTNGVSRVDEEILQSIIDLFIEPSHVHFKIEQIENGKLVKELHNICLQKNIHMQISTNQIDMHLDHMTSLLNGFSFTVNISCPTQLEEEIHTVDNMGLSTVLCFESPMLNRLYPNIEETSKSAQSIASQLGKYNCHGFSFKLSSKSKQVCNFASAFPSILIAGSMGWSQAETIGSTTISNIINYLVYEDDNDVLGNFFVKLGNSIPETVDEESLFDNLLSNVTTDCSVLNPEQLQESCRVIKTCKQDIQNVKLGTNLSHMLIEESSITLNLMFFLARICYGLKNMKIDSPRIEDLPQLFKSDNSNRLMSQINEYELHISKYYASSTTASSATLYLLKTLLKKILPINSPQSSGLFGVFTV